ncbi:hypothetical protein GCM10027443_41030 [Pontibacter brevis]
MNQIASFFSETLISAVGWTLLHSLWQGAFIALLLALLLVLLHRQSARVRYAVSGGALMAQSLLASGTFLYYYNQPLEAGLSNTASLRHVAAVSASEPAVVAVQSSFWIEPFAVAQLYFEQHMPLLVTLWLLGLMVMAIRFIGGVAYTQRLCHYRTMPLGAAWQQRMGSICEAMGVKRTVRLMESAMVQVPVAIGVVKPVILMPLGAVSGLTQAQVEAILAHELAHILRKDYLVNLLQSVVDMLFFYHPAIWWMSGVVRAERENCCDDMAVAFCGDTLTYARALAEVEAMRLPAAPAMATAFSGKRGRLVGRIKRLVGQQSLKPTFSEGFAAALVLVMGLTVLSFGAVAGLKPQAEQDTAVLLSEAFYDDLTDVTDKANAAEKEATGAFVYTVQDSAGRARDIVIIKNKKGKVTELYVDGKRIPNRYIDDYKALVDQQLQTIESAPRASRQEVTMRMEQARAAATEASQSSRSSYPFHFNYSNNDSLQLPPPPAPPVPPHPAPAPPPAPAAVPPVPPVAPFSEDEEAYKKYEQELEAYEAKVKTYEEGLKAYEQEIRAYEEELRANGRLNGQHYTEQVEKQREMAQLQTARNREMAAQQRETARQHAAIARQHQKVAQKHQEQMQKLKEELVKDGIIQKGDDNLNIQFNNEGLHINGKKQPQEVYEKYKKLMNVETKGSSSFNFQYKGN